MYYYEDGTCNETGDEDSDIERDLYSVWQENQTGDDQELSPLLEEDFEQTAETKEQEVWITWDEDKPPF